MKTTYVFFFVIIIIFLLGVCFVITGIVENAIKGSIIDTILGSGVLLIISSMVTFFIYFMNFRKEKRVQEEKIITTTTTMEEEKEEESEQQSTSVLDLLPPQRELQIVRRRNSVFDLAINTPLPIEPPGIRPLPRRKKPIQPHEKKHGIEGGGENRTSAKKKLRVTDKFAWSHPSRFLVTDQPYYDAIFKQGDEDADFLARGFRRKPPVYY